MLQQVTPKILNELQIRVPRRTRVNFDYIYM